MKFIPNSIIIIKWIIYFIKEIFKIKFLFKNLNSLNNLIINNITLINLVFKFHNDFLDINISFFYTYWFLHYHSHHKKQAKHV